MALRRCSAEFQQRRLHHDCQDEHQTHHTTSIVGQPIHRVKCSQRRKNWFRVVLCSIEMEEYPTSSSSENPTVPVRHCQSTLARTPARVGRSSEPMPSQSRKTIHFGQFIGTPFQLSLRAYQPGSAVEQPDRTKTEHRRCHRGDPAAKRSQTPVRFGRSHHR